MLRRSPRSIGTGMREIRACANYCETNGTRACAHASSSLARRRRSRKTEFCVCVRRQCVTHSRDSRNFAHTRSYGLPACDRVVVSVSAGRACELGSVLVAVCVTDHSHVRKNNCEPTKHTCSFRWRSKTIIVRARVTDARSYCMSDRCTSYRAGCDRMMMLCIMYTIQVLIHAYILLNILRFYDENDTYKNAAFGCSFYVVYLLLFCRYYRSQYHCAKAMHVDRTIKAIRERKITRFGACMANTYMYVHIMQDSGPQSVRSATIAAPHQTTVETLAHFSQAHTLLIFLLIRSNVILIVC